MTETKPEGDTERTKSMDVKKNMKQYLEDNPDLLPKGLNVDSEYTLSIRKPKK